MLRAEKSGVSIRLSQMINGKDCGEKSMPLFSLSVHRLKKTTHPMSENNPVYVIHPDEIPLSQQWYYFGRCTPKPVQIPTGTLPHPPYKRFYTESQCQAYIDIVKIVDQKLKADEWHRAGGDVVCPVCHMLYSNHPIAPKYDWLNILCDGTLVKL